MNERQHNLCLDCGRSTVSDADDGAPVRRCPECRGRLYCWSTESKPPEPVRAYRPARRQPQRHEITIPSVAELEAAREERKRQQARERRLLKKRAEEERRLGLAPAGDLA